MTLIQKLRWKFVVSILLVSSIILMILLSTMYVTTKRSVEQTSFSVLHQALANELPGFSENPRPKKEDDITEDSKHKKVNPKDMQIPIFKVKVDNNLNITLLKESYCTLTEEELKAITSECLSQQRDADVLADHSLRYCRQKMDDGWLIAFSDITYEKNMLSNLMKSLFLLGLISFAALFVISLFLARIATQPAEKAWDEQRRFLADASHELKTPLTVILANLELMSSSQEHLSHQEQKWMDNIQSESRRMRYLVEEMLCLARSDSQNSPEKKEIMDFSEIVTDSVLRFEPLAYEQNFHLDDKIKNNLYIKGIPRKMTQMVDIFLDNAIKYSIPGGKIQVELSQGNKNTAVLRISNPAENISKEHLSKLFHRFYRIDPSRNSRGGFGLGLSIAYEISKEIGAKIKASSQNGIVTFCVQIPLAKNTKFIK